MAVIVDVKKGFGNRGGSRNRGGTTMPQQDPTRLPREEDAKSENAPKEKGGKEDGHE